MTDAIAARCLEIFFVVTLVLLAIFPQQILRALEGRRKSRRRRRTHSIQEESRSRMVIGLRIVAALIAVYLIYIFWISFH